MTSRTESDTKVPGGSTVDFVDFVEATLTEAGSVCTSRLYTMLLVASPSRPKFACSHKLLKLREDAEAVDHGASHFISGATGGCQTDRLGTVLA